MMVSKTLMGIAALSLALLCVGAVLAQPTLIPNSSDTLGTTSIGSMPPMRGITNSTGGVVSPGVIVGYPTPMPYPYYYGGFFDYWIQLMVNAKDAQYEGLAMRTVSNITTITAQEVSITSNYADVHATDIKVVIDNNAHTVNLTAAHLEFKNSVTSFTGDNVSLTSSYYQPVPLPMQGGTGTSPSTVPPTVP